MLGSGLHPLPPFGTLHHPTTGVLQSSGKSVAMDTHCPPSQRGRPPLPPPTTMLQRTNSGTLYIPSDSSTGMKNEYNTIRSLKKGSLDSRTYACAQENTYHEPTIGNHNHVYSGSSGSSFSGGNGTNSALSCGPLAGPMGVGTGSYLSSAASSAQYGGPNTQLVGTFGRLGSGVAPFHASTNPLAGHFASFGALGTNSGLPAHVHGKDGGFFDRARGCFFRFFCARGLADGCWKAASILLLLSTLLLAMALLAVVGNPLNNEANLPCPASSTINSDELKSDLRPNAKNLPFPVSSTSSNGIQSKQFGASQRQLDSTISSVDRFERVHIQRDYIKGLPSFAHWDIRLDLQTGGSLLRFRLSINNRPSNLPPVSIGVYGARNRAPSHTKYDFAQVLHNPLGPVLFGHKDSNNLFNKSSSSSTSSASLNHEFVQFLDKGVWFLSFFNDQDYPIDISLLIQPTGVCPVLCSNNGRYHKGECICEPGFKGKECELNANECEVSDCNGHGYCLDGQCHCFPGYKGQYCKEVDCLDPFCSGHGQCINGMCVCHKGYRSADCSEKVLETCVGTCSSHGQLNSSGQCVCDPGWTGSDCSIEKCSLDCGSNGSCQNSVCVCKSGFHGDRCQHRQCSPHCANHGQCLNNGTCLCNKGFNGKHCTLDGCANDCNKQGTCIKKEELWQCRCNPNFGGDYCEIPLESNCTDKIDNDRDGLVDCADSECCSSPACANSAFCLSSADPMDILMRKQPPPPTASFFQRMQFLIEENSVQSYAKKQAFNESRASVIRGQVVDPHGNGLMGVRVGLSSQQPNVGFVASRRGGHFDLMVNGGGVLLLHLLRDPFQSLQHTVYVPWNSIVVLDRLVMQLHPTDLSSNNRLSASSSSLSASASAVSLSNIPRSPLPVRLTANSATSTATCADHEHEQMRFALLDQYCLQPDCSSSSSSPANELTTSTNNNRLSTSSFIDSSIGLSDRVQLNLTAYRQLLGNAAATGTSLQSLQSHHQQLERLSVVRQPLPLPASDLKLVYNSDHADGYLTLIKMQLTGVKVPSSLIFIHVNIKIEGNLIEQRLEAEPNLLYTYGWDKRNVYRQKVYGIASAVVSIGYEYVNCDHVIWDIRQIALPAADLPMAELGGLSIDVQHRYNPAGGVLQRGDGERHYLAADAQLQIETLLGDGVQRPLHCTFCNGPLQSFDSNSNGSPQQSYGRLLAPVAMASAPDGSVYLADYNLIRRIDLAAGRVSTVVELNSSQVAYKYHLAVSPVDGKLYVSDPERYQVFVVRQLNPLDSDDQPIDPRENLELFAGNGIKCLPGDKSHCGDRRPARQARLAYPKALAVNSLNEVFIADGTNIRYVDTNGIIHTLLGDHHVRSHWRPFPCSGPAPSAIKVSLRWPTELAFHPLDGSLHLLDDQMVLRLTSDRRLQIVAGRPAHCTKADHEDSWTQSNSNLISNALNSNGTLNDNQAIHSPYLETPQAIAFTPDGKLLVAESDSQHVNRIRLWNTQMQKPSVSLFAGYGFSSCSCLELSCECFDHELGLAKNAKLSTISALSVTPAGHVLIADQGNLRIRLVRARSLPRPVNSHGDFELHWPPTNEIYLFNRYGQHSQTFSALDRRPLYSFVYSANSSVAKLSAVIERGSGRRLNLLRDHQHQIRAIESSAAPTSKLSLNVNKQRLLSDLRYADGRHIQIQYDRGTGLMVRLADQPPAQATRQLNFQYDPFGRLLSKKEQ